MARWVHNKKYVCLFPTNKDSVWQIGMSTYLSQASWSDDGHTAHRIAPGK